MALESATKKQIMTEYATVENDTGSPEVQVAMLTRRISDLTDHLKAHKHDHHRRRGLLLLGGRRRRWPAAPRRENVSEPVLGSGSRACGVPSVGTHHPTRGLRSKTGLPGRR